MAGRSERMSPVDTAWLRMDRATNRMVIIGIMMLDGPVDYRRLEATLADRLLAYGRFRQRVEERPTGFWWVDDPGFDIGRHVRRLRLPGEGGKDELQRYVAELASQPFDMAHPPWRFDIIEAYRGGAAIVSRLHHAIADGMALTAVVLSMTDGAPEGAPDGAPDGGDGRPPAIGEPAPATADAVEAAPMSARFGDAGAQPSGEVLRALQALAGEPDFAAQSLRAGAGIASELAYLLLMPSDSPTRFKGVPSGNKRVAWNEPLRLPDVKAASHALDCSVNDILLAAVAGALRSYLQDRGDPIDDIGVRALVPVNLRPAGQEHLLGNRFGIIAALLPVGIADPVERLYETRRRMLALKQTNEALVTYGLFAVLGLAPKLVQDKFFDLLISRASAVMTNVPGPQKPIYLAGSRIREIMFWVPQSGDIGMGVSILSFDGKVQFGLITDAAMVPDPEEIVARIGPEFEQLLYFVLMSPWSVDGPATERTPLAPKPVSKPSARKARPRGSRSAAKRPARPAPAAKRSRAGKAG
ncbi:MAG TPA: wax ester/triacylglycerol synthase family O-acyltransferase [Burkholderiaceae bacterium]|nr:wax ester/triacylglycerol synthase family O-acyltransferase [Burkholderiaceae bacterium]